MPAFRSQPEFAKWAQHSCAGGVRPAGGHAQPGPGPLCKHTRLPPPSFSSRAAVTEVFQAYLDAELDKYAMWDQWLREHKTDAYLAALSCAFDTAIRRFADWAKIVPDAYCGRGAVAKVVRMAAPGCGF